MELRNVLEQLIAEELIFCFDSGSNEERWKASYFRIHGFLLVALMYDLDDIRDIARNAMKSICDTFAG